MKSEREPGLGQEGIPAGPAGEKPLDPMLSVSNGGGGEPRELRRGRGHDEKVTRASRPSTTPCHSGSPFPALSFTPSCLLIHPFDSLARGFLGSHVLSLVTSQTALLY